VKTRDRILETSLRLFNEEGMAKVPTNRIAVELEMSPGNLYYHFRQKELIVERLLRRLEDDVEPLLGGPGPDLVVAIDDLWLFLHLVFEKMFEFRCFYRDVDFVATEYPRLAPRLPRINARGLAVLERLCGQLASAGSLRAGNDDIKVLAMQMLLVATCWFTFARMLPPNADTGPGRAAYQVLSLLAPFLDDDGRQYMDYLRRKYIA
jgi:AcrR family transcriptional regulator